MRRGSRASYPWYDSGWLAQYTRALEIVRHAAPEKFPAVRKALDVFRTPTDFRTVLLDRPFSDETLREIRGIVAALGPGDLEPYEEGTFRRLFVRDHPAFARLHREAAALVSAAAGEEVEPSYNFLSLYSSAGVCPPHLDAPMAKWTLDLCVDQDDEWPLHLSRVHRWEEFMDPAAYGARWEDGVKRAPRAGFESFTMQPGQAIVFSGSSQWHYRDPLPNPVSPSHKGPTLLFFHFIPRGSAGVLRPEAWAELFGIPELSELAAIA